MKKNEKGITLIALIITIVIMLVLLSTVVYTGIDTYRESLVTAFVTKMQILQEKVDILVQNNNTNLGTTIDSSGKETEINNIITEAINEITIWDIANQNIKYFSITDINNILEVDKIDFDIIVNFDTREIVSLEGIEYSGVKYYTQYNLPQGQKLIMYDKNVIERSRNELTNFDNIIITRNNTTTQNITIDNPDGLNCTIIIPGVELTNGTLKYKLEGSYWQTITNYTETGKDYAVQVSKSGIYYFRLIDNTNLNIYKEESKYIEVVNSPKSDATLGITTLPTEYDYSVLTDSTNWAYATVDNQTYLWIPRLVYKEIYYTDNTYTQTQTAVSSYMKHEVKFIKGIVNLATDDTYIDETSWTLPSAFVDDLGQKLTGKWVEVSSTSENDIINLISGS